MAPRRHPRTATVPEYRLRSVQTHLRRILAHTVPDRSDTRTVNTYRLARQDLRWLDTLLPPKASSAAGADEKKNP